MAAPANTMRRVRKRGYEGVYERIKGGRVVGYTAYVPDASRKSGKRAVTPPGGGSFDSAKAAKDARVAALAEGAGSGASMTVREFYGSDDRQDLSSRWRREFWGDQRTISTHHNFYALKSFVRLFGPKLLADMSRRPLYDDVRGWGRVASLNNMKAARAFLYDAMEAGLMDGRNPLAKLNRGEKKSGRGRADIYIASEEELYELGDCALEAHGSEYGAVVRAHFIFDAHTALRPAELRPLPRANVRKNPKTGEWEVLVDESRGLDSEANLPKNDKDRVVACPPPAKLALDAIEHLTRHSPYAFPNRRGGRLTKGTQYNDWNKMRVLMAGRTGEREWLGRDFYEVTRHYCGAYLLNVLELDAHLVAHQLGHTGQTGVDLVLRLYGHPDEHRFNARINDAWRRHEQRRQAERDAEAGVPRLRAVE